MKRISTVIAVLMLGALVTGNVVGRTPEPSEVFSAERVHSLVNYSLAEAGFSVAPEQVVVGSEGWLYLGDQYSETITHHRVPDDAAAVEAEAEALALSLQQWEAFLAERGSGFTFLVGPNKSTIYPEFLPAWSPLTEQSFISVFAGALEDTDPLVLPHHTLREASRDDLTYFRTDSHWNDYGAFLAYQQLMGFLDREYPQSSLESLLFDRSDFSLTGAAGGDLTWLLSLGEFPQDSAMVLREPLSHAVRETLWESGEVVYEGVIRPDTSYREWTRIESPDALNSFRVLWLRDSFGTRMAPYMFATFDDILMRHFERTDTEDLLDQIEAYQPDLVVVTHVERDLPGSRFAPGGLLSLGAED